MIPHDTPPPAQHASEKARRLADAFVGLLAQFGYTATLGAVVNYGQKVSLSHPSLSHTLCAVIYVGKEKASFVKEGKNWPDGLYDSLLHKFRTLLEPELMVSTAPIAQSAGSTVAYVDGSYCEEDRSAHIGWAFEIWRDGESIDGQAGSISHPDALSLRNVAGECHAVEQVLEWCRANDCTEIEIRFDYIGLENWANGTWRTNAVQTQRYRERVESSGVRITWTKVQAHTGEYGNTRVDYFARHAATHHAFFPELPVSILPAHFRRSRTAAVSCR